MSEAKQRIVILIVVCAALAGCGRFTRPGASEADLARERNICNNADPRLNAEYDRLTNERAQYFAQMQRSPFNSPAYLRAEANHRAVAQERDRLSGPMNQAFQRCMRERGWTWTTS